MRLLRLLLLAPLPLLAVYTYFFNDTFSGTLSTANWDVNGTVNGGTDGLYSAAANGGSVVYKIGIPAEYEAKMTLKISASGGTYILYLRASNDGLSNSSSPQGSYYAMEMTPTLTSGGCTMAANHYKRSGAQ